MICDYVIPECNLLKLQESINKLNKVAKKLGLTEISLVNNGISYTEYKVRDSDLKECWINGQFLGESVYTKLGPVRNWLDITVNGTTPKFSGWEFCATLMPVPVTNGYKNQIRKVPGTEDIPVEYRDKIGQCDHCNTYRKRNETYLVKKNGKFKMVGSACVKDFLGHTDVHSITKYLELLNNVDVFCNQNVDDGAYSRYGDDYELKSVLALTSAVIRKHGWVSKGKASEINKSSTTSNVIFIMNPPTILTQNDKDFISSVVVENEDNELADNTIEWMKSINYNETDDYLYNLSLISRSDFVNIKSMGLACSAVITFKNKMRKKQEKEETGSGSSSNYVGEVKVRMEMNLTVDRIHDFTNDFGLTRIHHMHDQQGNYIVWFCSGNGLEQGRTYHVKATIKAHSEYNGIKQTIVNRVSPIK